jgi:RsmE family RNA methyltransferase
MNLVLFHPEDLSDDGLSAVVSGRRLEHVRSVLKISEGDSLKAGLLDGMKGTAVVDRLTDTSAEFSLNLNVAPSSALPLALVLAMPRPKVLRRLLASVASLGIKDVFIINACRVEKSYWQSPVLSPDGIKAALVTGLEQSGDTVLPDIRLRKAFKPFVEDELPSLLAGKRGIACHPYEATPLSADPDNAEELLLAIGPEGGFVQYEASLLNAAGMELCSLGERILKVETAVPYVVGRLCPRPL